MQRELKKIAFIDDDDLIYSVVKFSLVKLAQLDLAVYTNGKDALAGLNQAMPDLILLDYMMPDMDGPAVLKEIRQNQQLKNIPVFFLTAKSENEVDEQLLQHGAQGVIHKPFNPKELGTQIKNMWSKL
jgi:CheY-like chemotaxis protein